MGKKNYYKAYKKKVDILAQKKNRVFIFTCKLYFKPNKTLL